MPSRIAHDAKLPEPTSGGLALERPEFDLEATLTLTSGDPQAKPSRAASWRLLVLAGGEGGGGEDLSGSVGDRTLGLRAPMWGRCTYASSAKHRSVTRRGGAGPTIALRLHHPRGILAAWVVQRVDLDASPPGPPPGTTLYKKR